MPNSPVAREGELDSDLIPIEFDFQSYFENWGIPWYTPIDPIAILIWKMISIGLGDSLLKPIDKANWFLLISPSPMDYVIYQSHIFLGSIMAKSMENDIPHFPIFHGWSSRWVDPFREATFSASTGLVAAKALNSAALRWNCGSLVKTWWFMG